SGPEVDRMMEQIKKISNLEWEADKRQAEATRIMFDHEPEIGALSVVLWMNIFRALGPVADHSEKTADLLRVMLALRCRAALSSSSSYSSAGCTWRGASEPTMSPTPWEHR